MLTHFHPFHEFGNMFGDDDPGPAVLQLRRFCKVSSFSLDVAHPHSRNRTFGNSLADPSTLHGMDRSIMSLSPLFSRWERSTVGCSALVATSSDVRGGDMIRHLRHRGILYTGLFRQSRGFFFRAIDQGDVRGFEIIDQVTAGIAADLARADQ